MPNLCGYFHVIPMALGLLLSSADCAASEYLLEIRNHLFFPEKIYLPANKKIRLVIINHDATAEEFESRSLNREKIIPANSRSIIFIGPLNKGTYDFFGEFNPNTAVGEIIVE